MIYIYIILPVYKPYILLPYITYYIYTYIHIIHNIYIYIYITLRDGRVRFQLGVQQVIKGWDLGICRCRCQTSETSFWFWGGFGLVKTKGCSYENQGMEIDFLNFRGINSHEIGVSVK